MKVSWRAILLVVLITLLPLAGVSAQGQNPFYVVQPGDTLFAIARAFGTSVDRIIQANGIADPSVIFPGMELFIPGYEGIEGELTLREVVYGESLMSLSLRYGIPLGDLARLNRSLSPESLYAGQRLVLPAEREAGADVGMISLHVPQSGEGRLALALQAGVNPWLVQFPATTGAHTWVVPGCPLIVPSANAIAHTFPEPVEDVEVAPSEPFQGQTAVIRIHAQGGGSFAGQLGEHELHFFNEESGEFVALQGVHAMAEPGLYDLTLTVLDEAGSAIFAYRQPLNVQDGGYGFSNINGVPPETVDPELIDPEQAQIEALLAPATPQKYWQGPFQFPSDFYTESFLATFGTRRSYNWGALNYYHTGVDFYGGTGVPVLAAADGVVVFTGEQIVRGNVTYLDHGWGVYSGYFHQSEFFVSEGDVVTAGQVIGAVGNTGRSTGSHLHWEIWVGGVPVDPLAWIASSFP